MTPLVMPAASAAVASHGPRGDYFPNYILETHQGKKVLFYNDLVKGRKVLFNMMYTQCTGICPPNTLQLLQLQQALQSRMGRDLFMYSLTLRPEFDRARDLAEYAKRYGVRSGWTFLTGKPEELNQIRRKLGFYSRDPAVDSDVSQHTGMLRIGDERRDRWLMAPVMGSLEQTIKAIENL